MMDKSEFAIATSQTYRAFQIDKPYRHNQNLVGTLHATSLLWSTKMKTAISSRMKVFPISLFENVNIYKDT